MDIDENFDGVVDYQDYSVSRINFYELDATYVLNDADRDGVLNPDDRYPTDPLESVDSDGDGIGDNAEAAFDSDGDGFVDGEDAFPDDINEWLDTDGDGIGNNSDPDDDNDGVADAEDIAPEDAAFQDAGQARFTGIFGGAELVGGTAFTFPGNAFEWAGFANENTELYPLTFEFGGQIQFTASVPSGGAVDVRFRLERLPYLDSDPGRVDPSYNTEAVTVVGVEEQVYTLDIPAQGTNTFESFLLYLNTRDVAVVVSDVRVVQKEAPLDALGGIVYHWANQSLVAGVSITRGEGVNAQTVVSGADGKYAFAQTGAGMHALSASLQTTEADLDRTITSADALAALKIAVGLNPNSDPDGSGPLEPVEVSPYQLIAADMNGDGRVTSADALAILKVAVGLSDALTPTWALVADDIPLWDTHNDKSTVHNSTQAHSISYPEQTHVNFAAILVGDVNASWSAAAGTDAVSEVFLSEHARKIGAPLSVWGILDSDLDGLSDTQETNLGTSPNNADSDGDGVSDGDDACQDTAADAPVDETGCEVGLSSPNGANATDTDLIAQPLGANIVLVPSETAGFSLDQVTTDLYLRGDMNDWDIDLPLVADEVGNLSVSLQLNPGTYGFKLASSDWLAVDLGAQSLTERAVLLDSSTPVLANSTEVFVLTVTSGGVYHLSLTADDSGTAVITVSGE
jgi:hypothetical protein